MEIVEVSLVANPDETRGIPVHYRLIDADSDLVRVVFQWQEQNRPFPALLEDPGKDDLLELQELMLDRERLREKHICTVHAGRVSGQVLAASASQLRLGDLETAGAALLGRAPTGLRLEIQRLSDRPVPVAGDWDENPLSAPVAALPSRNGTSALVLDGVDTWKLVEVDLASGASRDLTAGAPGSPRAMTFERGERSVLVAHELGGLGQIDRVSLVECGPTCVPVTLAARLPGPVRALASLGTESALVSAGDALLRVSWSETDLGVVSVSRLIEGLATPWGIALDPLHEGRVYLAERDASDGEGTGRVSWVDIDRRVRGQLRATPLHPGESALPRPTAIALEQSGRRLLALCQPVEGKPLELRALQVAGEGSASSVVLSELPDARTPEAAPSLATGPDLLRLIALPGARDLAIGGGVEQERVITGYDARTLTVTVDREFRPALRPPQRWRIVTPDPYLQPGRDGSGIRMGRQRRARWRSDLPARAAAGRRAGIRAQDPVRQVAGPALVEAARHLR